MVLASIGQIYPNNAPKPTGVIREMYLAHGPDAVRETVWQLDI